MNNSQAPTGTCLYGDDLVSSFNIASIVPLPTPVMKCNDTIQLLQSYGYDPVLFCTSSDFSFSSTCCQTCAGIMVSKP